MQLPDVQKWLDRLGARFRPLGWALGVQDRFSQVHGGSVAAAITLTAFLTLFPLLVVAVAVLGYVAVNTTDFTERVIDYLGLDGRAADLVADAIDQAARSRRVATVVGVIGLLWTGLGLAGVVGGAYNTSWQVRGRGLVDRAYGLAWLAGSGALLAATFATVAILDSGDAWTKALGLVLGTASNVALFLWTSWVLPNRRVKLRALLAPAVVGAVVFEALKLVGTVVVPRLVTNSSTLWGTIGVVFAILAWLLLLGRLVVYVAILEVIGWETRFGTQRTAIHVPALPGRFPAEVSRSGER